MVYFGTHFSKNQYVIERPKYWKKNKNMLLNYDQVKHNLEELSLILKLFVMFDLWMKRYSQKWPEFEYQIAPK